MKHFFVRVMFAVVATLTASSAYADNCGESDRWTLPQCVGVSIVRGTNPAVRVNNKCSHPITVKFVKSGGDIRSDIPSGQGNEVSAPENTTVACCPRYNSCEDIVAGMPPNLARGKPATQSSTSNSADAARAVDGNSDGNFFANTVTHTNSSAQPWWQVDLGAVQGLREVVIYNRTDAGPERLSNFEIKVSNDGATWTKVAELAGTAPQRSSYPLNANGRYVRVQLRGTEVLSLAEIEVYGP